MRPRADDTLNMSPIDNESLERRRPARLCQDQVEEIADLAARRAVEMIKEDTYQAVGKTVLQKLLWLVGFVTVGIYAWLEHKGFLGAQ